MNQDKVYTHEDGLLERIISNRVTMQRLTAELIKQGKQPSKSYIKKEKKNEKK